MSATRQNGFTVLELLIVIIIFSMITLLLANGQSFALRAWGTQERQLQVQGDVGAVQNAIRQLLVSGRGFQGDDQSLHWAGTLPQGLNRAGLFDITLKLDGTELMVSWQPHFNGPMPKADPEKASLTGDVQGLKLLYYVQPDQGPGQWAETLPKDKKAVLIQVVARLAQGRWPPLIVAPKLEPAVQQAAPAANGAPGAPPQPNQPAAAVPGTSTQDLN
jgi:prepilin-type N-terminal cleavage/methylation domain-containing protein